jgi:hypothetical protein
LWILTTLPTGQWHMLIGQMESGIQSHMQHKMSHRRHWQQFRQFAPRLTFNATFKYHSLRMFWIYVFNIVPQDWDSLVYHMIVGAHISVVAASLANERTNQFHSLLLQARSLFQSSKCSTVVQSLTLQTVDFLAGLGFRVLSCTYHVRINSDGEVSWSNSACFCTYGIRSISCLLYCNQLSESRCTSSGKTKLHWSLGANDWTLTCDWIQLCTWMGSKLVRKLLEVN